MRAFQNVMTSNSSKGNRGLAPEPAETAFHSLLRSFGLLRQVMEPYFARFGISGSHWAILRVLQRAEANGETGLRLTDLGERLLIQPPSVTGVVDRLERHGLVQRAESKRDLRVRQVSLTPQGRKLVTKVLAGHADQIRSLFAAHQPEEMEALAALLHKLEARLKTLAEPQAEAPPLKNKPVRPTRPTSLTRPTHPISTI